MRGRVIITSSAGQYQVGVRVNLGAEVLAANPFTVQGMSLTDLFPSLIYPNRKLYLNGSFVDISTLTASGAVKLRLNGNEAYTLSLIKPIIDVGLVSVMLPPVIAPGLYQARVVTSALESNELTLEVLPPAVITAVVPQIVRHGEEFVMEGKDLKLIDGLQCQVRFRTPFYSAVQTDAVVNADVNGDGTEVRCVVPFSIVQGYYGVSVFVEDGVWKEAGSVKVEYRREVGATTVGAAPMPDEPVEYGGAGTAVRTDYEINASGEVVAVYENGAMTMPKFYRTGFGSLSTMDGKRHYELADQLGNVRCVVNESATVVSWSDTGRICGGGQSARSPKDWGSVKRVHYSD